jgi:hypothetical protein
MTMKIEQAQREIKGDIDIHTLYEDVPWMSREGVSKPPAGALLGRIYRVLRRVRRRSGR